MRGSVTLLMIALGAAAIAWISFNSSPPSVNVLAGIDDLKTRIDGADDNASTASSSGATASEDTSEVEEAVLASVERSLIMYISGTGGRGVRVRDSCADDAQVAGAWPEASLVLVLEDGDGVCDGWNFVSSGLRDSWVRDRYLQGDRPPPPPPRPLAAAPVDKSPEELVLTTGRCADGADTRGEATVATLSTTAFLAVGVDLCPGDQVEVFINGVSCGTTRADDDGLWVLEIDVADACLPDGSDIG